MTVPSNTFTPSRCAFESRPLRVEPPPLVFDMRSAFRDAGDFNHRILLAVSETTTLVGTTLVCEAIDLWACSLTDDGCGNSCLSQFGWRGKDGCAVDEKHCGELHHGALLGAKKLDLDLLALGDLFLFASGCDNCVHNESLLYPSPYGLSNQPDDKLLLNLFEK